MCIERHRSLRLHIAEWLVSRHLLELVLRIHECFILQSTEQFQLGLSCLQNQLISKSFVTVLEIGYPTNHSERKNKLGKCVL